MNGTVKRVIEKICIANLWEAVKVEEYSTVLNTFINNQKCFLNDCLFNLESQKSSKGANIETK